MILPNLLSVADARDVMREAARAARRDEAREWRDMNAPATGIETAIAAALIDTMTGVEFAEALDKAGLTIARASAADIPALDALRDDAALAAVVARTADANLDRDARYYAKLVEGDYAAVTRNGDVFRLNPTALDFEDVEQRLADTQPRLPSVVEARALNEQIREQTAELWAERRADNAARAEARAEHAILDAAMTLQHGKQGLIDAAEDAVDRGFKATGGLLRGFAKAVESVLGGVLEFFGGGAPKLTPMQAELAARANEELAEARANTAAAQQKEAAQDWSIFAEDRQRQQDELDRKLGYRDRDGGRERERERDRY